MAFANHTCMVQPDPADFSDAGDWYWADQLVSTALEAGFVFGIAVCLAAFNIHTNRRMGKAFVGSKASKLPWSYAAWVTGKPEDAINAAAGTPSKVLKLWRKHADHVKFAHVSGAVVQAYLELEPDMLANEIVDHLWKHNIVSVGGVRVLDAVAEARNLEVLEDLLHAVGTHVPMSFRTAEMIITAYATMGEETRLDGFMEMARVEYGTKMMPRHFVAAIRGLLHAAQPEQAMKYAKEMIAQGYRLNPRQLTEIFQSFTKHGRAAHAVQCGLPEIVPTPQAILFMMEHALRCNDLEFAGFLDNASQRLNIKMHKKTREAYVRILVANDDPKALRVFSQMLTLGAEVPDNKQFLQALYNIAADHGCQDICRALVQD